MQHIILSSGGVSGEVTPPPSKSYAQRAIVAAMLSHDSSTLQNMELCDDTAAALRCARSLGAQIEDIGHGTLRIKGGSAPLDGRIDVGESALCARIFLSVSALFNQQTIIEGSGSIADRPMYPVVAPLSSLGVECRYLGSEGFLPIATSGRIRGGEATIDGGISSQFVTGLLMALPLAQDESLIHLSNPVSKPYIDVTIDLLRRFGIDVSHNDYTEFYIPGAQSYRGTNYTVEGDWSAAAMMLVAGAIAGEVHINNLSPISKQADRAICEAITRAGAEIIEEATSVSVAHRELSAFSFDATDSPDLIPALAALASACEGQSIITGTSRLKDKESNRAQTIYEEYTKMGIEVDISTENVMKICGARPHEAQLSAHGDHRIAMSVSVAALRSTGHSTLQGAECVAKSYPKFFDDLHHIQTNIK